MALFSFNIICSDGNRPKVLADVVFVIVSPNPGSYT